MKKVGWIGLGHMGSPMALNLSQAGHHVNVYNRTVDKTIALVEAGATKLDSPKAIVEQSDVIFMILSDAIAVKEVISQQNGVLEGITPGKVIVDMSTISPNDSSSFASSVSARGGIYIDAPVSGSVGAAKGGQLVILVGSEDKVAAICKPYFDILGKETIYFGSQSKGSAAKLSINLLLGIIGQGIAETLILAENAGLDREKVLEMISQSGMNTPLFQGKKEMYRNEAFPSAFMIELMAKDLGLAKTQADLLNTYLPLTDAANETYRTANENGKAKLDMAAVYLELKERNAK